MEEYKRISTDVVLKESKLIGLEMGNRACALFSKGGLGSAKLLFLLPVSRELKSSLRVMSA